MTTEPKNDSVPASHPSINEILDEMLSLYHGAGPHQCVVLYIRDNDLCPLDQDDPGYSVVQLKETATQLGFPQLNLAVNKKSVRAWKKGEPCPSSDRGLAKVLSEPMRVMAQVLEVHEPYKFDLDRTRDQQRIKNLVGDIPPESIRLMSELDPDFAAALRFAGLDADSAA